MADLDIQIEMERAQAQLEYAPNSAFGSTTQNVQGGGGSVQTAPATQDTQSLEEEETNLPDPFEEEINLPEWFEDLLDFGNELLKPWSQSGEGISHGVGRVPREVVAGAGLGRTEPQRHAAPCVAPIRASREADAEHAPAPPPALSQPFGCAARPPSPQPGPSNRLSPPPPLEAAARRRRPRKVCVSRRIPLPANDDDYDHPSPAHSSIGWTPSCSNSNNSNFLMASDFFQQITADLDNQIEMERAQAQLEYAPNSAFGSTTQNVQGGGGSVQTAPATQDTQSLEEEETNLPDPFEEEINLPDLPALLPPSSPTSRAGKAAVLMASPFKKALEQFLAKGKKKASTKLTGKTRPSTMPTPRAPCDASDRPSAPEATKG
ncbi:uncharacterized protein LOC126088135 [Schistocerca cancellata]|uniref:uncharacterized protein LOC126088135 n=1 Tax=Schistocerca cancellata TaxID=274614 RepID=UPI0021185DD9|nr:uncharacterized protein LOC126088135 [Schistocerca cancellata]